MHAVSRPPVTHPDERLADDGLVHLRLAPDPLHELDGHLDHTEPSAHSTPDQVDLEAVSRRRHRREVQALEGRPAPNAVATGGVRQPDPEGKARVAVAA